MIFLSLILEGVVSFYLKYTTIMKPLFVVTNMLFLKHTRKSFIIVSICGILYDVIYTDTLFLNAILFLIIYIILDKLNLKNKGLIFYIILDLITIIAYKLINFCIFSFFNITDFSLNVFIKEIYSSCFLNIIYTVFLYFIYKRLSRYRTIDKNML